MAEITEKDFEDVGAAIDLDFWEPELKKLDLENIRKYWTFHSGLMSFEYIVTQFLNNGQDLKKAIIDTSKKFPDAYLFGRPSWEVWTGCLGEIIFVAVVEQFIQNVINYCKTSKALELLDINITALMEFTIDFMSKFTGEVHTITLEMYNRDVNYYTGLNKVLENLNKYVTDTLYIADIAEIPFETLKTLKIENFMKQLNKYIAV